MSKMTYNVLANLLEARGCKSFYRGLDGSGYFLGSDIQDRCEEHPWLVFAILFQEHAPWIWNVATRQMIRVCHSCKGQRGFRGYKSERGEQLCMSERCIAGIEYPHGFEYIDWIRNRQFSQLYNLQRNRAQIDIQPYQPQYVSSI